MKTLTKIVAALVLLAPLAAAQQSRVYSEGGGWSQEFTGTLSGAKNLRVKMDGGSVRVLGGSQTDISYVARNRAGASSEEKARRMFDTYKISAYVHGDTAWIVGEWQGRESKRSAPELVVNVPRDIESVKIETGGGGVTATGINGGVEAETGGGPVHMQDIGGSVRVETGGDRIEVSSIGGDANLETGGGQISIGAVKGKINASTGGGEIMLLSSQQGAILEAGGGNIQVKQCGGKLRVSTGGGNIDVGDVSGPVEMETGGGSIHLMSSKGPVRAETGAGRIELDGVPAAHAETGAGAIVAKFLAPNGDQSDSVLETSAGDVTVYVRQNLSLSIRASIEMANGHNIHSEFPEIRISSEGGQWGPKSINAEGNLNGGGPRLKMTTTTGDITIRREQ